MVAAMERSSGHRRREAWEPSEDGRAPKGPAMWGICGRWRPAALGLVLLVVLGCTPLDGGNDVVRPRDTRAAIPTITALPASSSSPTIVPSAAIQLSATPATPVTPVTPVTPTFIPTQPPTATRAEVIYAGEEGLHLRAAPNEAKIATFLKGSLLTIRGTPRDAGGFRWWPVDTAVGWVAEGSSDPSQPVWLAPLEGSGLGIGRTAQVVYGGGDGLNLRRAPGPGSEKIATLLKPSSLVVVDGPRTVDGVRWWMVQVGPGWIAEGALDVSQPRWLKFVSS